MRRVVLLAVLLSVTVIPYADASGGVIDSVTVTGDGVVGEGPIEVNISLVGSGGSASSSVNWNVSLFNSVGNIVDSDSGNAIVSDGTYANITTMLGDAPLGYSNLSIVITGDVGSPGENQYTEYYKSIHRLRPLDVSLYSPTLTSVDENGNYTGNLSINDGDYVDIEIPVINDGDVDWSGILNTSIDSILLQSQSVNVTADTTKFYSIIYGPIHEGIHFVNLSLNGTGDGDPSDEHISLQFEVGPPPLPEIVLNLTRINNPNPGSNISWNLRTENIGNSLFDGEILCEFNGDMVYSEFVQLATNNSINSTVTILSKPGELFCTSSVARTVSTLNATDTLDMSSAIFLGAGHSTPSLLGGPWHVGDKITVSILLRNEGDLAGSAMMQIEINGQIQNGSTINLDRGKAGEINHEFFLQASGNYMLNWSVISNDGVVDSNLSGTLLVPVEESQKIDIEIENLEIADNGIDLYWSIELSEGKGRDVTIYFGPVTDGIEGEPITEERYLLSGKTYGSTNIGFQNGQMAYAIVSAISWSEADESTIKATQSMPDFTLNPNITANSITSPSIPIEGSEVTVSYILSNNGNVNIPGGKLIITDNNGEVLESKSTPEISTDEIEDTAVVTWPSGSNVVLTLTWHVGDVSTSDVIQVKSKLVESESSDFEIPIGGILSGLVLGMVLIFLVRMKNSPKDKTTEKKKKNSKTQIKDMKVDVECPTCSRKLRVPADYTGGVRCPECDVKFEVESQIDNNENLSDNKSDEKELAVDELYSSSSSDILACPKCARNLKVPYERRPAKARCPACETIFEARKS